jgi:hypothetical protein
MDSYENPLPGKTYISPSLNAFGQQDRKVRIASKAIVSPDAFAFATVRDEVVLRHKTGAKSKITAKFFEDDRDLFVLSIQGYTAATDKPHNASFSFIGDEIGTLLEFIANIRSVNFTSPRSLNIADEELRELVLSKQQARTLVVDNEELFTEVVSSAITKRDVVAIGYRKRQLDVFRRLLEEPEYFAKAKEAKQCSDESLWQKFFEKNPWVFGYGLNYIYLENLDCKKLEQVVQGFHVGGHGKRVDALMKTKGALSSLCLVEMKTHVTPLLAKQATRAGCWPASSQLTEAVSQVQGTVAAAMDTIRGSLKPNDDQGYPTGEEAFNYAPKSYLVTGNLGEFIGEHGVNKDKLRSFELFRRNLHSPEIITFDELYERAKFIVDQNNEALATVR